MEVNSVRATTDIAEIGELNPQRPFPDRLQYGLKVINTLRSNGILMANITRKAD